MQIKDLSNAIAAASVKGFSPLLVNGTLEMLKKLSAKGHGGDDHSVLFKYYDI